MCSVGCNILSRVSDVGSPTYTNAKYLDRAKLVTNYQNLKKDGPYTGPVLLRQGEPGTSQYFL